MAVRSISFDRHVKALSTAYPVSLSDYGDWIIVHRFWLPPGFNWSRTDALVEIPGDYPLSPPGVGSRVYLPPGLRYRGNRLRDLHVGTTPGWGQWAWFCYEWIRWDPRRDDLIRLMEMIRADLTNPPTC